MEKIYISYETYDSVLENLILFGFEPKMEVFSEYDVQKMLHGDLKGYLSILIWVLETSKDPDIRRQINKALYENLIFIEKKKEPESFISTDRYRRIYEAAVRIPVVCMIRIPDDEELEKRFHMDFPFYFGMFVWILKNEQLEEAERRRLREFVLKHMVISDTEQVLVSYEEYMEFCEKLETFPYRCGNYLPTREEIQKYILPNMDHCYDFIMWILETGDMNENVCDQEIRRELNLALKEKVQFTGEKEIDWLWEKKYE